MPNRSWRSGKKQPPQQREPQKQQKKTLEDACLDIKKSVTSEHQARLAAEKRAKDAILEDQQMAMIYGPNWKQGLPSWALEYNRVDERERQEAAERKRIEAEVAEEFGDDYDEDGERVIPFPRDSEVRFKKRKAS